MAPAKKTVWDDPAFAKAWNDTYGIDMQKTSVRADLAFPLMAEQIGNWDGKTLADFGCGNGNLIRHFAGQNFQSWVGIDGGRAILDTAIANTTDARISYEHRDLCDLFKTSARVDVVTSMFVLEEIPATHLRNFFANVAGMLKADGTALMFTQHPAYAMMEAHKALAAGTPNTKFEGHRGYFDTNPSTYALQLLNQRDGEPLMAAHHHKPLMTIVNDAASTGLALTHMVETPAGIGSLKNLRAHTPAEVDFPRFLFLAFSPKNSLSI